MKILPILSITVGAAFTALCSGQQPQEKPNILILLADDLGWGDVGFHKGHLTTPHLDRLAKESVEMQRFYAYPVCSPARAGLLTGQMPRRFGIADVVGPQQNLPAGVTTLPGTLHAAGYQTSLIGKWHLGQTRTPQMNGFDHFYGFLGPQIDYMTHTNQRGNIDWQRDGKTLDEKGYSTFLLADETIRQLKQHDPQHPFFIEVAFNAVHFPYSAPAELIDKYKNLATAHATYAAITEALDTSVGRILTTLDESDLRKNTIVLFFSDNGSGGRGYGSNAPLRGGKSTVFEGGIRMPCLIRWPGQTKPGTTSQLPISVHDLFPTLIGAAGVPLTGGPKLDGKNLWEPIRDGQVIDRGVFAIAAIDSALFDGDWKLIETSDGKQALYQISKDPAETTDLLANEPETAKRLAAKLAELKKDLPAVQTRPRPGAGGGGPGGAGRGPGGGGPGSAGRGPGSGGTGEGPGTPPRRNP